MLESFFVLIFFVFFIVSVRLEFFGWKELFDILDINCTHWKFFDDNLEETIIFELKDLEIEDLPI